jgi:hypothetical protein
MVGLDYELGLKRLQDIVQRQAPGLLSDFSLFRFRLQECLSAEEKYGESSNNTAEKNRVLEQLILFTSEHFGLQFIDLCRSENSVKTQTQPYLDTEQAEARLKRWQEGDEVKIQEGLDATHYIVHDPITVRWSADHSACYQQAKAQQIGTTRVVWLKQVQVHRDTTTSTNWQAALQREGRLLDTLEERQDQPFPRRLAFEQRDTTTTLVQSVTQGRSWQYWFGSPDQLNAQQIYTLLRSAISLCTSLKPLHERNLAHRMLLPEHILLLKNNRTVLQDVGLSAWKYEPGEGPERYRAPEQRVANTLIAVPGPYTDIYQLGTILYHLITRQQHASQTPIVPLRTWNSAISPEIDAVLQRALEPEIKKRWSRIADFSAALRRTLH